MEPRVAAASNATIGTATSTAAVLTSRVSVNLAAENCLLRNLGVEHADDDLAGGNQSGAIPPGSIELWRPVGIKHTRRGYATGRVLMEGTCFGVSLV